jgi:hypothetical protein
MDKGAFSRAFGCGVSILCSTVEFLRTGKVTT